MFALQTVYVNSANLTTIPSCGSPLYANVNLNVLGTDAYRFESGANFYGAGGVLQVRPFSLASRGRCCAAGA